MTNILKIVIIAFISGSVLTLVVGNASSALNPYFMLSTAVLVVALAYSWHLIKNK